MKAEKTEVNERLLTIKDIAQMFQYTETHIKRSIITQDDFPVPIRLTSGGVPRWKTSEVLIFIESRRDY